MSEIEPKEFILKNGTKGIIRAVQEDDAEKLLRLLDQIMADNQYFVLTPEDIQRMALDVEKEKDWIKKHQKDGATAIVTEIDGDIVGLVDIINSPHKRLEHIGVLGISVLQRYRDMGLGSELIKAVLDWAKKDSLIEKVALAVFSNNRRAIHLYKKFGFAEEGRRVKEVKYGQGEYVDDILMYQFVK